MKSIAWMTFVLALAVALTNSQRTSFDMAARNLASHDESKLRELDRSATAVEPEALREFSRMGGGIGRTLSKLGQESLPAPRS